MARFPSGFRRLWTAAKSGLTSRSTVRPELILAGIYLLLFLFLFSPWDGGGLDDVFYYSYLSSALFDGDVDVLNDYFLSNNSLSNIRRYCGLLGPKGLVVNQYAAGSAILWFPFHFPVRVVGWCTNWPGSPPRWANDRFSPPYLLAISLATLCYGFLTLLLIYAICAMEYRPLVAGSATLGIVLASPLLAHIFQYSAMSHTQSAFSVALLLYLSLRHREFRTFDSYLLTAAALGLATLVRWQNLIFGLIPAALWMEHVARRGRDRPLRTEVALAASAAVVFLALVSIQLFYWRAQIGKFVTIPQGGGYLQWSSPKIHKVLFAPWNGLYYWHPVCLLASVGLFIYVWRSRRKVLGVVLLVCVALMTYLNAVPEDWMAGGGFGSRRFCGTFPLFGLGLAAFYSLFRRRLAIVPVIVTTVAIVANVLLHLIFTRSISRPILFADLWALGPDWVHLFPEWIRAIHLNSQVFVYLLLAGEWTKGLFLVLLGLSLVAACMVAATRNGFLFLERKARFIVAGALGIVIVLDLLLVLRPPAANPNGLTLSRLIPAGNAPFSAEKRISLEQLVRARYANPLVYFYAAEKLGDRSSLPDYLRAVCEISPEVWAKWVEALPPNDVGEDLRQEAAQSGRPTFLSAWSFYRNKIRGGGKESINNEPYWLKQALRFNPFDPWLLRRSAEIAAQRGHASESKEFRSRWQRYLKARLHTFFAFEEYLAGGQSLTFRQYYLDHATELGRLYEDSDQTSEAIALYDNAARLAPDNPRFLQRKMILEAHRQGPNVDEKAYLTLLNDRNILVDTYSDAAQLSMKAQNPGRAIEELKIGFKYYPDDARLGYHLNLALGMYEAKAIPFDELLASKLASFQYWLVVANNLNAAGRFDDAVKVMARFRPELSRDAWAGFVYGFALCHTKRYAEAEPFLRKAVDTWPDSAAYAVWLVRCLLEQGKHDEAVEIINRALVKNPDDAELLFRKKQAESATR